MQLWLQYLGSVCNCFFCCWDVFLFLFFFLLVLWLSMFSNLPLKISSFFFPFYLRSFASCFLSDIDKAPSTRRKKKHSFKNIHSISPLPHSFKISSQFFRIKNESVQPEMRPLPLFFTSQFGNEAKGICTEFRCRNLVCFEQWSKCFFFLNSFGLYILGKVWDTGRFISKGNPYFSKFRIY